MIAHPDGYMTTNSELRWHFTNLEPSADFDISVGFRLRAQGSQDGPVVLPPTGGAGIGSIVWVLLGVGVTLVVTGCALRLVCSRRMTLH